MVICNNRYLEMYGLSPKHAYPGASLSDMLKQRAAMGTFAGGPELFFLGFDMGIAGGLGWGMWGWEVGELIATELGTFREADRPAEFGGSLRKPSATAPRP
jgi:hypothetical protein